MRKILHQYGPDEDTIASKVSEAAKIQKVESVRFYRWDRTSTYGYLAIFKVDYTESFDEAAFTERLNASLDGIVLMHKGYGKVGRIDKFPKEQKYEVTVEIKPKK